MEENFDIEKYIDEFGDTLREKGYHCFIVVGDEKEGRPKCLYLVMKGHQAMLFSGLNMIVKDDRTNEEVKALIKLLSKEMQKSNSGFWSLKHYFGETLYLLSLLTLCFLMIGNLSINYSVNKELLTLIVFIILAVITSPLFRSKIKSHE